MATISGKELAKQVHAVLHNILELRTFKYIIYTHTLAMYLHVTNSCVLN